jgi:Restriction endonuclease XhoI
MASYEDYNAAIKAFWAGRDLQTQKQIQTGKIDAGTRGSVTGGRHLTALHELIASEFVPLEDIGAVIRRKGILPLPGYYRRAKNWDIVVTLNDILVAAIECKSQSGSFGNNGNNRVEEAIGNAVDLWRAYEAGFLGTVRPWLGFVYVLEHAPGSTRPVGDQGRPLYRTDPAFDGSSYTARFQLGFQRLVRERLYDAACLISTIRDEGILDEPLPEVSTRNLTAAIAGRVAYIQGLAELTGAQSQHRLPQREAVEGRVTCGAYMRRRGPLSGPVPLRLCVFGDVRLRSKTTPTAWCERDGTCRIYFASRGSRVRVSLAPLICPAHGCACLATLMSWAKHGSQWIRRLQGNCPGMSLSGCEVSLR